MAKHDVTFSVPARPIAYKDIEFEVKSDGRKLGELRVSQGGVLWVPRDHTYGHHLSWKALAELMEQHGQKDR